MVNKELNIPFIFNYIIINELFKFINNKLIIKNNEFKYNYKSKF